jgi:phage/plasmid-associated DNA primase
VLAWAVRGATRLLERGHFPELVSSKEALKDWAQGADPVLGWIEDRVITGLSVVGEEPPRVTSRKAYTDFRLWAGCEGYSENSLPSVNNFVQRLSAAGASKRVRAKHSGSFRGFVGMRLKPLSAAVVTAKEGAA